MNKKQTILKACISTALTVSLLTATSYSGFKTLYAFESVQEADMAQEQSEIQPAVQIYPVKYVSSHEQVTAVSVATSRGLMTQQSILAQINDFDNIHYVGECTLTAYCCEPYKHICGTGNGLTATGLVVQPGFVAVDPSVIPLGSTVIIGENVYLAADTGGAIKGNRIDIAMETHQEALDYGKHIANVWYIEP